MKRRRWIGYGCASGIALGLVALNLATRPRWKTATEAELLATLSPELAKADPRDPAGEARLARLEGHLEALRISDWIDPRLPERIYEARNGRNLGEILDLAAEGPLSAPPVGNLQNRSFSLFGIKNLSSAIAQLGVREFKTGHRPKAIQWLVCSTWLSEQMGNLANSPYELTFQRAADDDWNARVEPLLSQMSEAELAALAKALPAPSRQDENLRRSIRSFLRLTLLPAITDPARWAATQPLRGKPDERLAQIAGWVEPDVNGRYSITFDAIQTAKDANRIFLPSLSNAGRAPKEWDRSGVRYANSLRKRLPMSQTLNKQGFALELARLQYRWEMAQVPNTFGSGYLYALAENVPGESAAESCYRRTLRESLRARIALARYRLRFSRPAPTLIALVEAGLLTDMPQDHCDRGPLRYDSKRRVIWSVGRDGLDSGGKPSKYPTWQQPDAVWRTP